MSRIDLKLEEVPLEAPHRVNAGATGICVIRTNGTIRAFLDRCPHAHWPLSEGELKNGLLQCIGHGWEFDVETGSCVTVPVCRLKAFPAIVDHGIVRIEWDDDC
jgi:nitrite reductase (NADH) small subunit